MGKKIFSDVLNMSPKKHSPIKKPQKELMDIQNPQALLQGLQNLNMQNLSIDHKKPSNMNGKTGSGKTQENPQVQEERKQTMINEFKFQGEPENDENVCSNIIGEQKKEDADSSDNHSKLMKKRCTEYIKFFKFYYDRVKTQHPNWTPQQITKIVSLQWKKKKLCDKMPSKSQSVNESTRRSNKPLTAKDAFKMKHRDLSKAQIDQLWSKLPQESRNYWKRQGESYGNNSKLSEIDSMKNSRTQTPIFNTMRFLLNQS